jgi:hypothetical protein
MGEHFAWRQIAIARRGVCCDRSVFKSDCQNRKWEKHRMLARPAATADLHHIPARCPVVDAAHRALQSSPYWAIRRVRCSFHEGQLTLHGQVPTFYLLQVAQELVCRLPGVEEVEKRIVVDPSPPIAQAPAKVEPTDSRSEQKLPRRTRTHTSEFARTAWTA